METHISWLLITEWHVFKMKKPVKFSFLDFSTPALREHYCRRELELNRRIPTGGMYMAVVEIQRIGEELFIGDEDGDVVDFAVMMKRQDTSLQMHRLLEQGRVDAAPVKAIACKIAAFHHAAKLIKTPFDAKVFEETFDDLISVREFVIGHLDHWAYEVIDSSVRISDRFVEDHKAQFQERVDRRLVRDVHGDLHSGNIFLYEDPVIFDCIEFNDAFRQIDLLNEIGFFLMDLDAWDQEELGEVFLGTYLEAFPEVMSTPFDRQLLTYYKLYRANVRAKVMALNATQHEGEKQQKELVKEAEVYLHLMERYLKDLETG